VDLELPDDPHRNKGMILFETKVFYWE